MEMIGGVSKETFVNANGQTKDALLYDLFTGIVQNCAVCQKQCAQRFEKAEGRVTKLEKRKKVDAAASAGGGVVGGFLAMLLKKIFF